MHVDFSMCSTVCLLQFQGVVGGGFQPMHTKPIMPQRGYTPTSGSSRSSHTESDVTYSKGDNHNIKQLDRGHHPVAL